MKVCGLTPSARRISILFVAGSLLWGCAPQRTRDAASADLGGRSHPEVTCEIALLRLEWLIEKRSAQKDFPLAVLLEAKELYKMGQELYLEREYALALELVEEGIQLVEEETD